jgi:hypothetical protein
MPTVGTGPAASRASENSETASGAVVIPLISMSVEPPNACWLICSVMTGMGPVTTITRWSLSGGGAGWLDTAFCYDCSPPVEKAIYHGSRAWALTLIPLHEEDNLAADKVATIKAGLARVHG